MRLSVYSRKTGIAWVRKQFLEQKGWVAHLFDTCLVIRFNWLWTAHLRWRADLGNCQTHNLRPTWHGHLIKKAHLKVTD